MLIIKDRVAGSDTPSICKKTTVSTEFLRELLPLQEFSLISSLQPSYSANNTSRLIPHSSVTYNQVLATGSLSVTDVHITDICTALTIFISCTPLHRGGAYTLITL